MGEFLRRAELPVALTFALPRTRGNGKLFSTLFHPQFSGEAQSLTAALTASLKEPWIGSQLTSNELSRFLIAI